MPTNPKWLEHTERAAWDTVKTLRQKLEEERQRAERLSPVGGGWKRLLESLDAAKQRHGIEEEHYADVLDALCARLEAASGEQQDLKARLAAEEAARREQVVEVISSPPGRERLRHDDDDADETRSDAEWFAERVFELASALSTKASPQGRGSIEKLMTRLELKLEELEDARPSDAFELAAEIGALAMTVAKRRRLGRR